MHRTDPDQARKAKTLELRLAIVVFRIIDLVDHQHNRARGAAQFRGQLVVEWQESVLSVDDKEHDIGTHQGMIGRAVRGFGKIGIRRSANATGVDDAEGVLAEFADRLNAVARHPGLVVHDGNAPPGEAVEEGGLSDIRTAHEDGFFHCACAAPSMACRPRHM